MKYKIGLLIILFPAFIQAQTSPFLDSSKLEVTRKLIDFWTLGIDSNSNSVDLKVYNNFKNLFDATATIDDDFNYQLKPLGKDTGTYVLNAIPKPFEVYAHDVALEISKLRIDTINTDQGKWSNNTAIITITRKIWADKSRRYLLKDTAALVSSIKSYHPGITFEKGTSDSMMIESLKNNFLKNLDSVYRFQYISKSKITLVYNNSDIENPVKIKSIKNFIDSFVCLNDSDRDGILDWEDSLKKKYGDFTSNGRPDYDFDGVPDTSENVTSINIDYCKDTYAPKNDNHGCPASFFITKKAFEGFIGLQFNAAKINLPELNQLGYVDAAGNSTLDVLQSKKGTISNPGLVAGIYGGGNFTYYFGKKGKRSGISAGFTYSRFTANYQLKEPIVYTYKSFDGNNFYRRQIEIASLNEDITYTIVNFPVMYSYRFKMGEVKKQWLINLKAGPSLMVFNNNSRYDAAINIGGLYQVDSLSKDKFTYYDFYTQGSTYNVNFTAVNINGQNPNPGAGNVFDQLFSSAANYDFASKPYSGKQQLTRKTIALNVNIDGQKTIAAGMAIKVGASFVYAPLLQAREKYKPIDNTSDSYQSIYNSNAKSSYYSFGINFGFVYNW